MGKNGFAVQQARTVVRGHSKGLMNLHFDEDSELNDPQATNHCNCVANNQHHLLQCPCESSRQSPLKKLAATIIAHGILCVAFSDQRSRDLLSPLSLQLLAWPNQ